jgi:hypothetical protein
MDQQRGRSPSAGHQSHINQVHSPSPQQYQENTNVAGLGLGLDPSLDQQYSNSGFPQAQGIPAYSNVNNIFLTSQGQQYSQASVIDPIFTQNQNFNQQPDFNQQFKQEDSLQQNQGSLSPFNQQQPTFSQQLLGTDNFNDFSLYSTPGTQGDQFDPNFYLNDPQQSTGQSINPSDIMGELASPPAHTPTPPHMLQPDVQQSGSAHHSPIFNQNPYQRSPGHSRHTSLGPESAAFPHGQMPSEWGMLPPQFTTHRRTPSEYSDVSVSSAAPSPNLVHHDTFESIDQHHSPLVRPQDPSVYQEVLGIGNFSLSDPQIHHGASPRHGLSPAHSPAISPRLGPQQMPMINQQNAFMINAGMPNNGFTHSSAPEIYGDLSQDTFGQQNRTGSQEMGQAQQMVAPEINVEFAPPSRQSSFEPPKPFPINEDALTPPERGELFMNALRL